LQRSVPEGDSILAAGSCLEGSDVEALFDAVACLASKVVAKAVPPCKKNLLLNITRTDNSRICSTRKLYEK